MLGVLDDLFGGLPTQLHHQFPIHPLGWITSARRWPDDRLLVRLEGQRPRCEHTEGFQQLLARQLRGGIAVHAHVTPNGWSCDDNA